MLEGQSNERLEVPNLPSGTVTFLFTDIEGSTKLLETLRELYASVLDAQRGILHAAFERWNGREIDSQGDSFFVAFARASDAVQCALDAQQRLATHPWPQGASVRVRMGLHTGEPLVQRGATAPGETLPAGEGNTRPYYIGMDVHRAARIAAIAHGGQVLLSQTTRDLIYQDLPEGVELRHLGSHWLKDLRYPQPIYQLVSQGLQSEFPAIKSLAIEAGLPREGDHPPAVLVGEKEGEVYRNLLRQWRAQGRQSLDKASLAMLLGAEADLTFDQEDLALLLRSALQNDLALEPWLKRADSQAAAVTALDDLLQEYPRPQTRLAIVTTLCGIPDQLATQILLRVAGSDDAHPVRSRAALEAASRGELSQVTGELARQAREKGDPSAIAALAAVIDKFGRPEGSETFPRLPVATGIAQLRWTRERDSIRRRAVQGATGGGLALSLLGSLLPLLAFLVFPTNFERNIELFTITAWVLSGAIAGLIWGGLQGLAISFAVCLAEVLLPPQPSRAPRFIAAGMAGWVFTALMILFASAGLMAPISSLWVYVPVFLVYGFLQGSALSWVIPELGKPVPARRQMVKVLQASLFTGLVAIPLIYLAYQEMSLSRLPLDWLYALFMSGGLAMATRKG